MAVGSQEAACVSVWGVRTPRCLDLVWPGAIHRSGLWSYPGQLTPLAQHFLHRGREKSQTSRLLRHSQHCFLSAMFRAQP